MTKLDQLLLNIASKHVYIQTHNFPDPDAIASAFGLQKLLRHKGIDSTICYSGKIDRHSTSLLLTTFGLELYNIDKLKELKQGDEVILVDGQKGNSNIIDMTGTEIICIDHHPISSESSSHQDEYRFCDIRPEVGACASIIASYFYENGIEMDESTSTVLLYGIKVDTNGLSRGMSMLDMDMFYNLYKLCRNDIIASLEHSVLQFDDLRAYALAINSIKVYGFASFANAGHNCPEALIASVSDFMLELHEVDFSVVYSFKRDGVKLSIRSEHAASDAGIVTSMALDGIGSGGGHASMAGGFIPYVRLEGIGKDDENVISGIIQQRFIAAIDRYTAIRNYKE